jgi:hypothetical protein
MTLFDEHIPTESEVRKLRDMVFGSTSTDVNWNASRDSWMRPDAVAWLRGRVEILLPINDHSYDI